MQDVSVETSAIASPISISSDAPEDATASAEVLEMAEEQLEGIHSGQKVPQTQEDAMFIRMGTQPQRSQVGGENGAIDMICVVAEGTAVVEIIDKAHLIKGLEIRPNFQVNFDITDTFDEVYEYFWGSNFVTISDDSRILKYLGDAGDINCRMEIWVLPQKEATTLYRWTGDSGQRLAVSSMKTWGNFTTSCLSKFTS